MFNAGITAPLSAEEYSVLRARAHRARAAVLTATSLAASGHPGGSFSSMEMYTLLYGTARLRPSEPQWDDRDRVVISHGHTSPGVYTALAGAGFFAVEEVEAHFRQAGSVFEGHVERSVPGVEWSTGNLGQGLSAGVGFALGQRLTGAEWHTFVAMSDGEQHKGQGSEARRLAVKEQLGSLTAIIDYNRVQISGHTTEVMPVHIAADWRADGWLVYECDGHDIEALHNALTRAVDDGAPSVVIANTIIGKGVSFMEDEPEFHGRGLTVDEYGRAMAELGADASALESARARRGGECAIVPVDHLTPPLSLSSGEPRTYAVGSKSDNRSAWGSALVDIAAANPQAPIAVLDCDLAVSVKTEGFAAARPEGFVQCGVGEHNAATCAGALSTVPSVLAFWADFGVFGIDEVYNQQRLNDINGAALKLVVTHCGLDVGEDGRTHQCLDYIGAMREFFGWRVIVPCDPNQTDRAVRAAASMQGNVAIAMGRSKLPIIAAVDGSPLFAGGYEFAYGDVAWAREGADCCLLATGTVAGAAVQAADVLAAEGIAVTVGLAACPLELGATDVERLRDHPLVVTVEDHNLSTGLGATVSAALSVAGGGPRTVRLGVSGYQSSGAASDLYARAGLDSAGIAESVRRACAQL